MLPRTQNEALDPAWLTQVLAPVTGGAAITKVEVTETLRTMATKIRFKVEWDGGAAAFCMKAFLDVDAESSRAASIGVIEADFYSQIASKVKTRTPACIAALTEREAQLGIILMRDLIADGARFCTALEPLSLDHAASSLDQLACLHAGSAVIAETPWLVRRLDEFATRGLVPVPLLQTLLDGPRGLPLRPETRDASRLVAALSALSSADRKQPETLIHGDCHAGNLFETADGFGLIDFQLIQRGNWALDVAYHIAAVLPVEVAEAEEWHLLRDYLARARGHGCDVPEFEAAQAQYRTAMVYGYYLWAITRRVQPSITETFVNRLGKAVERHESFSLLGI